jgi:hypothetical protein
MRGLPKRRRMAAMGGKRTLGVCRQTDFRVNEGPALRSGNECFVTSSIDGSAPRF